MTGGGQMDTSAPAVKEVNYKIGDYVAYRQEGICRISDIRKQDFGVNGETEYYILNPITSPETNLYVPVGIKDLKIKMRHLLTREEIEQIITQSEDSCEAWVDDSKARYEKFASKIEGGDRADILWVVKVLSLHRNEVNSEGKTFYATDKRLLETAEKMITEEFAFVLGIEKNQVIDYIIEQIEQAKTS